MVVISYISSFTFTWEIKIKQYEKFSGFWFHYLLLQWMKKMQVVNQNEPDIYTNLKFMLKSDFLLLFNTVSIGNKNFAPKNYSEMLFWNYKFILPKCVLGLLCFPKRRCLYLWGRWGYDYLFIYIEFISIIALVMKKWYTH